MFNRRIVLEIELTHELLVVVLGKFGRSCGNSKYQGKLRFLVGGPSMDCYLVGRFWQIGISFKMEGARSV